MAGTLWEPLTASWVPNGFWAYAYNVDCRNPAQHWCERKPQTSRKPEPGEPISLTTLSGICSMSPAKQADHSMRGKMLGMGKFLDTTRGRYNCCNIMWCLCISIFLCSCPHPLYSKLFGISYAIESFAPHIALWGSYWNLPVTGELQECPIFLRPAASPTKPQQQLRVVKVSLQRTSWNHPPKTIKDWNLEISWWWWLSWIEDLTWLFPHEVPFP